MATYNVKERLLEERTGGTTTTPSTTASKIYAPVGGNDSLQGFLDNNTKAMLTKFIPPAPPKISDGWANLQPTAATKALYAEQPTSGSASSGSSGGGSYSASAPAYDEIGALDAQRAQEEAMLAEYYAQQKALQEQLKNERLSLIENSQNELIAGANEAYNALAGARKSGYDYAGNAMNAQSDEALRQAYISKNMSERNLDQALSASGRSGGASETTRLGLAGAYANERGSTERQRAAALAKLLNELNQGQAEDTAWKTNLENQYRSQYVQGRDDVLSDTANAVSNYEAEALKTKLEAQRDYNARLAEAQQRAQAAALLAQRTR